MIEFNYLVILFSTFLHVFLPFSTCFQFFHVEIGKVLWQKVENGKKTCQKVENKLTPEKVSRIFFPMIFPGNCRKTRIFQNIPECTWIHSIERVLLYKYIQL